MMTFRGLGKRKRPAKGRCRYCDKRGKFASYAVPSGCQDGLCERGRCCMMCCPTLVREPTSAIRVAKEERSESVWKVIPPRRQTCGKACHYCKQDKKGCEDTRPCLRCLERGMGEECLKESLIKAGAKALKDNMISPVYLAAYLSFLRDNFTKRMCYFPTPNPPHIDAQTLPSSLCIPIAVRTHTPHDVIHESMYSIMSSPQIDTWPLCGHPPFAFHTPDPDESPGSLIYYRIL